MLIDSILLTIGMNGIFDNIESICFNLFVYAIKTFFFGVNFNTSKIEINNINIEGITCLFLFKSILIDW